MKWCREGLECIRCSTGVLRREYTSKQLFDQQMFFRTILDVDAAVRKLSDAQKSSCLRNFIGKKWEKSLENGKFRRNSAKNREN